MKTTNILLAASLVLLGWWLNLLIPMLALAGIILLISREPAKPSSSKSGTKVQPIIVKRKYEGPESIYPKEIKITELGKGPTLWKEGAKQTGTFFGKAAKDLWKWITE